MSIKDLRNRLKAEKPFLIKTFKGMNGQLMEGEIPISIALKPIGLSYVVKNKTITTFITKFTGDFQEEVKKAKASPNKGKVIAETAEKIADKVTGDEMLGEISRIIDIGKEILRDTAFEGWYANPDIPEAEWEKTPIQFVLSEREETENNDRAAGKEDPTQYIFVSRLTDAELMEVGMSLLDVMPDENIVNVPFIDKAIKTIEDKQVVSEEVKTVDAKTVGTFPSDLRNLPVQTGKGTGSEG